MRVYRWCRSISILTLNFSIGKVVAGYKVRIDENGEDQWSLLGKRNPLTPQMFYPVVDESPIVNGDKLAARCTMNNVHDSWTKIGYIQFYFFCINSL